MFAWPHPVRAIFWLCISGAHLALIGAGWLSHPRLIMFTCGILLRETIHRRIGWERFGNFAALAGFALALAFIGVGDIPIVARFCGPVVTRSSFALGSLFVSTYALGYYALGGNDLLAKWFSWDWLRWFGNISYTYYLTHGLVLHFLKVVLGFLHLPARLSPLSYLALCCLSIVTTVLGSSAVFLAVEKRFSFSKRSTRASRPVSAGPALVGS
jgi:peptidoglycan/LPS O-acetylase OafA/YrhL